jgi:hypothetical protein
VPAARRSASRRPSNTSSAIAGRRVAISSPATCRDGSNCPSGGALVKVYQVLQTIAPKATAATISRIR